ncbi:MAG: YggS family pyridoxal phosphate-dependent enzyme [Deltaproteobacteria bacterium]|nr:YggS family pyridoxal phosphate-dependent enzyme [Deltaproteobacteria bacterium]
MSETIAERLARIRDAIVAAATRVGRDPGAIALIAVGKGHPVAALAEAFVAGQRALGENYAHELTTKAAAIPEAEWHFVGHLQRNKVKEVVPHVRWIHTLDSLALAAAVDAKATRPIECCIEINIGNEPTKMGIAPEALLPLLAAMPSYRRLRLRGLMGMPPPHPDPEASRPYFRRLRELLESANGGRCTPEPLTELSMGMTNDYTIAIEEGATMVRIGTGIFGERP